MKAVVDQDTCISCGLCPSVCPEVFSFDDSEKAVAIAGDIPADQQDSAQEACDGCPVGAITIS